MQIHGYCHRHCHPCPYHSNDRHLNDKSGEREKVKKKKREANAIKKPPMYPCKCLRNLRKDSFDSIINHMYSVFNIQYNIRSDMKL